MDVQKFIEESNLEKIEELVKTKKIRINEYGNYGYTILHHAVIYRNVEKIKLVIKLGADTNAISMFGNTPLHLAETMEIMKILIDAGADIHIKDSKGLNRMGILLNSHDVWEIQIYTPGFLDKNNNNNIIRNDIERINAITKKKIAQFNFLSEYYFGSSST